MKEYLKEKLNVMEYEYRDERSTEVISRTHKLQPFRKLEILNYFTTD